MVHLKCLTVFWIRQCLRNGSVLCTVTLYYALHQTLSKFWHIQNSGIVRHIQVLSAFLWHINAYWGIAKEYSRILRTLCNPRILTILPRSSPDKFRTGGIFKTRYNFDQLLLTLPIKCFVALSYVHFWFQFKNILVHQLKT